MVLLTGRMFEHRVWDSGLGSYALRLMELDQLRNPLVLGLETEPADISGCKRESSAMDVLTRELHCCGWSVPVRRIIRWVWATAAIVSLFMAH